MAAKASMRASRPRTSSRLGAQTRPACRRSWSSPRSIANAYQLRGETSLAVFPGEVLTRLYATLGDARMALTAIAIGTQALAAAVILVAMMHL